jgi:multiple sugar transport system substrate-binding protein
MKKLICAFALVGGLIVLATLYGNLWGAKRPQPVTLMIWHTYVERMGDDFRALAREFNDTVGAKEGIVVTVATEANESSLNEMLMAAVKHDPGSPPCPDIAVVYPKIAFELVKIGALADLETLFPKSTLDRYVPQFLEEGMLAGDALYLLPIAKSTEVLYVNRTLFDRFAGETGVELSQLATFEGIMDAAGKYYDWTDAQTPDIPHDGKTFYYPDIPFDYAMIGFQQLGDDFVKDGGLNLESPAFGKIWDSYFPHAVRGSVAIFDKYGNYLAMTGDIVCATSTSAGAMFYPETVIYADNTKEDVSFDVLPYPVFKGGHRVVAQRGGGMCVIKSRDGGERAAGKERAAARFLEWFTAPAQNLRFTASTGYMPVTKEAFDLLMTGKLESVGSEYVRRALAATVVMRKDYRFFVPSVFDGFDDLQKKYVTRLINAAKEARRDYKDLLEIISADEALDRALENAKGNFMKGLR